MAGKSPAVMAVQGDCQWPMLMVEIPTAHISPGVKEAIQNYI